MLPNQRLNREVLLSLDQGKLISPYQVFKEHGIKEQIINPIAR
jgi:hypothetical protein